jgi:hypothetical protein
MSSDPDLPALNQIVPLNHVESNLSVSSDLSLLELCANISTNADKISTRRKRNYNSDLLSEFIDTIKKKAMTDFKTVPPPKKKCTPDKFVVPTSSDYMILLEYKYKKDQLKEIARFYNLRVSGTNQELLTRIYTHLKMSVFTVKIQSMYRGYLQRFCNNLRGPAFLKRSLCTNTNDFLTMENLSNIHHHQFVSYMDSDKFVYGFDVLSLYNLKKSSQEEPVKNPYNRTTIPKEVFVNVKRLMKIMKRVYGSPLDIEIEKEDISTLSTDERINRMFIEMDSHGHYTCISWFNELNRNELIRFVQELADIWFYRASLTPEVRYTICPDDPLRNYSLFLGFIRLQEDINTVREHVLHVIESFVFSGIDESARSLGVIYVLQSFTLVNENARETMPHFYQSVAYSQLIF